MIEPVITVRGLAKKYYLGGENYNIARETLSHLLLWPYRQLRGIPDDIWDKDKKVIWALKDINFDIYQGDRVGIIGKNGAGKSTLLKILSRLVYPTEGEARIRGRVTSLLEVGTGFNHNLSGRENIYLNASLHGLHKEEINEIFEDIVEFSEVKKFLDTPVKHYSSGMKMRLAFAVAAHLDPDILLLDEVLAVGDMSFQQKCLQRVEGLTSEGRTVMFVSHSMDAITRFCDRCLWLEQGKLIEDGKTEDVIASYVEKVMGVKSAQQWVETKEVANPEQENHAPVTNKNELVKLVSVRVINSQGKTVTTVPVHETIGIEIVYDILDNSKNIQPALHFKTVKDIFAFVVAYTDPDYIQGVPQCGRYLATVWLPPNLLNIGLMHVNLVMVTPDPLEEYVFVERAVSFNVHETDGVQNTARGLYARDFPGFVRPLLTWKTEYQGEV
ncbi:MAG: ATP-binding cassette domain-containing protein [Gomphosphaeria aponina SAG 52.96 = DSM 107014]|uniref:ATP-binding cassette domain-containing protein n=1 Tax=Gomphosphaeria aponina SAG 52.96 = DSM 107014 TaxID=1521640 RepID=A0A941GV65_9CHRO|nr:ATP-binding cassette domain-containing protein [Gomphosphaeria aponina SAG 52.96 = DSM 107014]